MIMGWRLLDLVWKFVSIILINNSNSNGNSSNGKGVNEALDRLIY